MPASMLATKLHVPAHREGVVARPQLISRLREGLTHHLTLICAPAGYGKTTLVADWVHNFADTPPEEESTRVAWLSLDSSDSDLQRFMTQLIASLSHALESEEIGGEATALLRGSESQPVEPALNSLINDLARIDTSVVMVLDDYHVIDSAAVDAAMSYLLEHTPGSLHLVVTTRSDPAFQIARLRARGVLTELRAGDLRFSIAEATAFLNDSMRLGVRPETVAALEQRTEGWIAGLQLAALSMRRSDDIDAFVTAFAGSNRFVMDYLVEEVLAVQPELIRTFLIQTSILNQFTGDLCDAVTGRDGGQETLERLERDNLFVVPLDDQRCWYRYHHLFRDLLARSLDNRADPPCEELHRRAAGWLLENGYADEAIDHARRAGMDAWAADILEREIEPMWTAGRLPRIRYLTRKLSADSVWTRPMVCAIRGYALSSAGQLDDGERHLARAEELASDAETIHASGLKGEPVRGRVATLRAMSRTLAGDLAGIRRYGEAAIKMLPTQDALWRGLAAMALGDLHTFTGDMGASLKAKRQTVEACELSGNRYYAMISNIKLAAALRELGRLRETVDLGRRQLDRATRDGLAKAAMAGQLRGVVGDALLELNDVKEARRLAVEGLEVCRNGGSVTLLGVCYAYLIRVHLSLGDLDAAEAAIGEMRSHLSDTDAPHWAARNIAVLQACLWVAQGEIDRAAAWMDQTSLVESPDPTDFLSLLDRVAAARVLLAQDRVADSLRLLRRLHEFARANNLVSRDIEILALTALAEDQNGELERAIDALGEAFVPAGEGGFIRTFVDEGPQMARLLYEAASRGMATDYVRGLLSAFPPVDAAAAARPAIQEANVDLFESLSGRELDVLHLIAEGLSNQQISERLFVSLHTVKTHARNLFAKLDTHSRTAAVNKARGLGLLPPV